MNPLSDAATRRDFQGRTPAGGEFLTFRLGAEEYGIDILKVQEIRGYEKPTRMANAPEYIKGVLNLRGTIVPIFDLRIKFSLETVEYNDFTVVIILKLSGRMLGVVVDSVSDVTTLTPQQIKPAPDFASHLDTRYVLGLGTLDERMLILMAIEELIAADEMLVSPAPAEEAAA